MTHDLIANQVVRILTTVGYYFNKTYFSTIAMRNSFKGGSSTVTTQEWSFEFNKTHFSTTAIRKSFKGGSSTATTQERDQKCLPNFSAHNIPKDLR